LLPAQIPLTLSRVRFNVRVKMRAYRRNRRFRLTAGRIPVARDRISP
jgi:hypothetical protein